MPHTLMIYEPLAYVSKQQTKPRAAAAAAAGAHLNNCAHMYGLQYNCIEQTEFCMIRHDIKPIRKFVAACMSHDEQSSSFIIYRLG